MAQHTRGARAVRGRCSGWACSTRPATALLNVAWVGRQAAPGSADSVFAWTIECTARLRRIRPAVSQVSGERRAREWRHHPGHIPQDTPALHVPLPQGTGARSPESFRTTITRIGAMRASSGKCSCCRHSPRHSATTRWTGLRLQLSRVQAKVRTHQYSFVLPRPFPDQQDVSPFLEVYVTSGLPGAPVRSADERSGGALMELARFWMTPSAAAIASRRIYSFVFSASLGSSPGL